MISINNVQPLSPESLFDLLKTELPAYVNEQLGSNVSVEFAHVSDIINISFPEVIDGNAIPLRSGTIAWSLRITPRKELTVQNCWNSTWCRF